jgi:hypothetical protein
MATDKKSIIVYADWKDQFNQLEDDEAGRLIKHFFAYVNDENPESDRLTELMFTPIKRVLKRDLDKWEVTLEKRSQAGKKSAEVRANKKQQTSTHSTRVKSVKQNSTNSTDSVNVSVSVNDSVILLGKETKEIFNKWVKYRKEIKKPIKSKQSIDLLIKKFNENTLTRCREVVSASIENGWQGLFWNRTETKGKIKIQEKGFKF